MVNEIRLKKIFEDLFSLQNVTNVSDINVNNIENWTSLNHLNLMISIENEFDINIPPEDFLKLNNNFESILKYIDDKISK